MNIHNSVLKEKAVKALIKNKDGIYFDCTFGRGGHSREILDNLNIKGRLFSLDWDKKAVEFGKKSIIDPRFKIYKKKFSEVEEIIESKKIKFVDGFLLDLGVSSPQLEDKSRGIGFKNNGPLDMRMDLDNPLSAREWINSSTFDQIYKVIKNYGEEPRAKRIAREIIKARDDNRLNTTLQLENLIKKIVFNKGKRNPATKTFQAIRIKVNNELDELEKILPICIKYLKKNGRIVIISFHSLEDRIVKNFFKLNSISKLPRYIPIQEKDLAKLNLKVIGKPVFPDTDEIKINPRSRSAIMRVAEKI